MRTKTTIHFALAALVVGGMTGAAAAETAAENRDLFKTAGPKESSKSFKPAPDKMETNFGSLEFEGQAFPTEASTQKDLRRDGSAARHAGLHGLLSGAFALRHL